MIKERFKVQGYFQNSIGVDFFVLDTKTGKIKQYSFKFGYWSIRK